MIHAYPECYLADAMDCLGDAADYAIVQIGVEPDFFFTLFTQSKYAHLFQSGNPSIISGMSGIELARRVLDSAFGIVQPSPSGAVEFYTLDYCAHTHDWHVYEPPSSCDLSAHYWAGFSLAYYQWYSAQPFDKILSAVPFSQIVALYPHYHELDLSAFVELLEERLHAQQGETRLKSMRELRNLSQSELAKATGVNVRSIQMYEQRRNDIDKAQVDTLGRIARVLGCSINDILEHPLGL